MGRNLRKITYTGSLNANMTTQTIAERFGEMLENTSVYSDTEMVDVLRKANEEGLITDKNKTSENSLTVFFIDSSVLRITFVGGVLSIETGMEIQTDIPKTLH